MLIKYNCDLFYPQPKAPGAVQQGHDAEGGRDFGAHHAAPGTGFFFPRALLAGAENNGVSSSMSSALVAPSHPSFQEPIAVSPGLFGWFPEKESDFWKEWTWGSFP